MNVNQAAGTKAIVIVGFIGPDWVRQVAATVRQVFATGVAIVWFVVLAVILVVPALFLLVLLSEGNFMPALALAVMYAIVVFVVISTWPQSMANLHKYIEDSTRPEAPLPSFAWSPWFYILTGVLGAIAFLFRLIGSAIDSPSVNIDAPPLEMFILLIVCVACLALGILGLFDHRFVPVARTSYITWLKIKDTAEMTGLLIGEGILLVGSIRSALTGSHALAWSIGALVALGLFITQLLGILAYWG